MSRNQVNLHTCTLYLINQIKSISFSLFYLFPQFFFAHILQRSQILTSVGDMLLSFWTIIFVYISWPGLNIAFIIVLMFGLMNWSCWKWYSVWRIRMEQVWWTNNLKPPKCLYWHKRLGEKKKKKTCRFRISLKGI